MWDLGLSFGVKSSEKSPLLHEMHEKRQGLKHCQLRPKSQGIKEKMAARRDSNSRPSGSKPFAHAESTSYTERDELRPNATKCNANLGLGAERDSP
jgi:hypothetical protein